MLYACGGTGRDIISSSGAGISCASHPTLICSMSAGVTSKGDVVVATSHTGKSENLITTPKIGKKAQVECIVIGIYGLEQLPAGGKSVHIPWE